MDISLQTALLGALMGSAVLAFSMIYGRMLSAAPSALGWWAAAFVLQTGSYALLIGTPGASALWWADVLHGMMAVLVLVGAVVFLDRPVRPFWLLAASGAVMGWALIADQMRQTQSLPPLPLYGIGGVPLLLAAWAFLTNRRFRNDGHTVVAGAFAVSGLHELVAPFLHIDEVWAPLSFVVAQITAIVTAVSLLVVVLRRQHQQAERMSRRANRLQKQFVEAVESTSEGFVLFGADDRLVLCNGKFREMLHPIAERLQTGVTFTEIAEMVADHGIASAALGRRQAWLAERVAAHQDPGPAREEQLSDGRWFLTRESRTNDGGRVAISTDVTERKVFEQAILEREARLSGIMDTVADGIFTMTAGGVILSFNPAAERIFGTGAGEAVGTSLSRLISPSDGRSFNDIIAHCLSRIALPGMDVPLSGRRRDGSTFPLDLSVTERRRGDMVTYIGVARDVTERRRVEDALMESEQRFRDLAESASDWFWETGPDLHFIFVSSRVRQVLGVKTAFFIGKTFQDLADSSDEPQLWRVHLDTLAARQNFRDFAFKQRLPDGRIKILKLSGRPVIDAQGAFRGYRGTATDITAEVEAKASAERAQAQLMAALESITEAFVLWDSEDRLALSNSKYRELFPAPLSVGPGTSFPALMRALAETGAMAETGIGPEAWMERRLELHRNPTGSLQLKMGERWLLVNERKTMDGWIVGVYTDITALKRREQEIAKQTELLQAIIDNLPQGISVFDAGFRLLAFNRMAQELFDLPPEMTRAGAMTYLEFLTVLAERGEFGDGDRAEAVSSRMQVARDARVFRSERVRPDGTAIEIRRNVMPDGGFVATYTDITERNRTEMILREAKDVAERASRAKAAFLASVSHELRTPLNAIIGFSELMMGQLYGPMGNAKYTDYIKDIHDSGTHLLDVINDILDMSKAEAGKVELDEAVIDVGVVIDSCLRLLHKRAETQNLTLDAQLPPGLPHVLGDERRLKQVLLNLLSNALKFTEDGGSVRVTAEACEQGFVIHVADTGIGMAPEDISKAMEPFAQIDSRLSRKYEGTGLGLPLTRALVEAHDGRLVLESAVGIGTTAVVTLPWSRVVVAGETAY